MSKIKEYELPILEHSPNTKETDHNSAEKLSSRHLLTLNQIRQEYPCNNCNAPCCTYLPLHTFTVSTLSELDHALYLLNFPRIELGLSASGDWGVYYRHPCRFLDRENGLCTVYEDDIRPSICAHYNPYSCWYKRVIGPTVHETFLRIDSNRMNALLEHIAFDEDHNIVDSPDWQTMLTAFESLPISPEYNDDFEEDSIFDQWLYEAAYGPLREQMVETGQSYMSLTDPCNGCGAFCCKYLVFPQPAPATRVNLDYLQFVLGFPNIEVGVSDSDWFIMVQTTCRHLSENRCSIFGESERPQICTFYDAYGCQYVAQFGTSRPNDFLRIRLEQFHWFVESIGFDSFGNITYMPQTEELRRHVERRWHETVLLESEQEAEGVDGPV